MRTKFFQIAFPNLKYIVIFRGLDQQSAVTEAMKTLRDSKIIKRLPQTEEERLKIVGPIQVTVSRRLIGEVDFGLLRYYSPRA